jgi:hypothetical protein
LITFARSRSDDDRKRIALLHTELCAWRRSELAELPSEKEVEELVP